MFQLFKFLQLEKCTLPRSFETSLAGILVPDSYNIYLKNVHLLEVDDNFYTYHYLLLQYYLMAYQNFKMRVQ